jgi:hypothetical protein
VDVFAAPAYQVPTNSGVQLHDLLTVFLDPTNGKGGILNVVNDTGGASTIGSRCDLERGGGRRRQRSRPVRPREVHRS